jgi:hypothetical protein
MPDTYPVIPFRLEMTSADPEMVLKGNIYHIQDVVNEARSDVNVPLRDGDAPLKLIAGHYAYVFNASKKGKLKLAAVMPVDPEPTPKEFDTEQGGQLGRVFYFVVSLP